MLKNLNVYRLLFISFLALLFAACIPSADFTVNPTPVVAGIEATFDASSTLTAPQANGNGNGNANANAAVTYTWNFGDGTAAANGVIVKHTFAAKGKYNVTLTVETSKGKDKGVVTKSIDVGDPAGSAAAQVQVQGSDGVLITGAKVEIGTVSAQSDAQGVVALGNTPLGADQVVIVTKAGYVSQSIRVTLTAGKTAKLYVVLQPVKETRSIEKAEVAQVIAARTLGASVTLPANALVNAKNQTAKGAITLQLTPWDIKGKDLSAMQGNGRGRDATGKLVDLISAGMMSVDFYDAQNQHLQVANGKTADIQMDLPYASINGKVLTVGSTIPLWHFDAAQGLWLAQGTGTVVASKTSSVGLAIKSTVTHFSTWSWDFPIDNTGSVNVSCVDDTLQPSACSLGATVILQDGSYFYKSFFIDAGVTTVTNLPAVGTMNWSASTNQGQLGYKESDTTGDVVIQLAAPLTSNFVQCNLADQSKVGCDVVQTFTQDAGVVTFVRHYYIPAEGAWVKTSFYTTNAIGWQASTQFSLNATNQLIRFEGNATSAITGNVNITLGSEILAASKILSLSCDNNADIYPANTYSYTLPLPTPTIVPLASCNISVRVVTPANNSCFEFASPTIAPGTVIYMQLPPMGFLDRVYISATGVTTQAGGYVSAGTSSMVNDLTNLQYFLLRLSNFAPPP
jgi:PKD repeat protein